MEEGMREAKELKERLKIFKAKKHFWYLCLYYACMIARPQVNR